MKQDPNHVISRIYDAVEDLDVLTEVMSVLCDSTGGESAILNFVPRNWAPVPFACLFRLDPELLATYNERHVQNLWGMKMVSQPVGAAFVSDSLIPFDQLRRTAFYGDLLEPAKVAHAALFMVDKTPTYDVAISIHLSLIHI